MSVCRANKRKMPRPSPLSRSLRRALLCSRAPTRLSRFLHGPGYEGARTHNHSFVPVAQAAQQLFRARALPILQSHRRRKETPGSQLTPFLPRRLPTRSLSARQRSQVWRRILLLLGCHGSPLAWPLTMNAFCHTQSRRASRFESACENTSARVATLLQDNRMLSCCSGNKRTNEKPVFFFLAGLFFPLFVPAFRTT